jgi:predicted nucleic acid-binding protein
LTTALDTNVIVALLSGTPELSRAARESLEQAGARGALVVSPPVYAELLAAPGRKMEELDPFLSRTGIEVDWVLDEPVWRTAAAAYREYAARRRKQPGDSGPRRILADFVIGAHAVHLASALLTLDRGLYRTAFPKLKILTVTS